MCTRRQYPGKNEANATQCSIDGFIACFAMFRPVMSLPEPRAARGHLSLSSFRCAGEKVFSLQYLRFLHRKIFARGAQAAARATSNDCGREVKPVPCICASKPTMGVNPPSLSSFGIERARRLTLVFKPPSSTDSCFVPRSILCSNGTACARVSTIAHYDC